MSLTVKRPSTKGLSFLLLTVEHTVCTQRSLIAPAAFDKRRPGEIVACFVFVSVRTNKRHHHHHLKIQGGRTAAGMQASELLHFF
jgi:hypothetical protein